MALKPIPDSLINDLSFLIAGLEQYPQAAEYQTDQIERSIRRYSRRIVAQIDDPDLFNASEPVLKALSNLKATVAGFRLDAFDTMPGLFDVLIVNLKNKRAIIREFVERDLREVSKDETPDPLAAIPELFTPNKRAWIKATELGSRSEKDPDQPTASSLATYRSRGEKAADGRSGIDPYGRQWRKETTEVWYVKASLPK